MIFQLAKSVLKLHILKKTAELPVQDKLKYLHQCYFTHGLMIPVMVICALVSAFFAIGAVVPIVFDLVHIGQPTPDGISNTFAFVALLLAAAYFTTCLFILLKTREILASYWLLIFSTHCVQRKT